MNTPDHRDPLDVIELASVVLVRNFELLQRRGGSYAELDRSEYLLLRTLDVLGPADICTLAKALGLDPSTAGRQVTAMVGKELVQREPAPQDRRRSMISPTEHGQRQMDAERALRRTRTADLLDGWNAEDLRRLGEMFVRYNKTVAEHYLTDDALSAAGKR